MALDIQQLTDELQAITQQRVEVRSCSDVHHCTLYRADMRPVGCKLTGLLCAD